jgi:hypothetical protein
VQADRLLPDRLRSRSLAERGVRFADPRERGGLTLLIAEIAADGQSALVVDQSMGKPPGAIRDVAETVERVGFAVAIRMAVIELPRAFASRAGMTVLAEPGVIPPCRVECFSFPDRIRDFFEHGQRDAGVFECPGVLALPAPEERKGVPRVSTIDAVSGFTCETDRPAQLFVRGVVFGGAGVSVTQPAVYARLQSRVADSLCRGEAFP